MSISSHDTENVLNMLPDVSGPEHGRGYADDDSRFAEETARALAASAANDYGDSIFGGGIGQHGGGHGGNDYGVSGGDSPFGTGRESPFGDAGRESPYGTGRGSPYGESAHGGSARDTHLGTRETHQSAQEAATFRDPWASSSRPMSMDPWTATSTSSCAAPCGQVGVARRPEKRYLVHKDSKEEDDETQPLLLKEHKYLRPKKLDRLANISYEESFALLKCNEDGVQEWFHRRDCVKISYALYRDRIAGSTLPMLGDPDIDALRGWDTDEDEPQEDVTPLNLGQKLALKKLVSKLKVCSRTQSRREEIWKAEEFVESREYERVPGSCPLLKKVLTCCCFHSPLHSFEHPSGAWQLPPDRYSLTSVNLKLVQSSWQDTGETVPQSRDQIFKPLMLAAFCDCFMGFESCRKLEPEPLHKVSTNNIDLSSLEDCDLEVLQPYVCAPGNIPPPKDIFEQWFGYKYLRKHTKPAEVKVTYKDLGTVGKPVTRVSVFVDPAEAESICSKFVNAMEDAQAEDNQPRNANEQGDAAQSSR